MKPSIVIGQSGGSTAVINASLVGAVAQVRRGAPGWRVLGAVHGIEGVLAGDFVDLGHLGQQELRRLARTPGAALGSCRRKLREEDAGAALEALRRVGAEALIYIGGNDSADTALRVHRAAASAGAPLSVIGVPKTIDNDLAATDHSPGFASAARYLAFAAADAGLDTEAMCADEPVKIIEVGGRNSGWLACAAALAKREERDAPQFVWPPEVPFDPERFLGLAEHWLARVGFCVAVVTETIRTPDGKHVALAGDSAAPRDPFGHPRVAGTAEHLCGLVADRLRVRAKWEKMGTFGRVASRFVSATDRSEAKRLGVAAVRHALRGASGQEVVLLREDAPSYRCRIGLAPLEEVANAEKRVPPEMFNPAAMTPTPAFCRYAAPLVGDVSPERFRIR